MSEITDIMIYESGSGGDISLKNDDIVTIAGLTNQVYLALFGGNIEQSTSEELDDLTIREDYWGNFYFEEENQFNSIYEKTLRTITLNTNGLSILKDAAESDLEYLKQYAEITISISIIGLNKVQLIVSLLEPNNISSRIKLVWDGTKNELIENIVL